MRMQMNTFEFGIRWPVKTARARECGSAVQRSYNPKLPGSAGEYRPAALYYKFKLGRFEILEFSGSLFSLLTLVKNLRGNFRKLGDKVRGGN